MTKWKILALCAVPLAAAACSREPPPPPVPVLGAAEQACVDRTVASTGADAASVSVVATGATKSGESIYATSAGGTEFTCVVSASGTVTSFTQSAAL